PASAAIAGLMACAPSLRPPWSPDDPANPAAPESIARAPSRTLEVVTSSEPTPEPPTAGHEHHHDSGSEKGDQPGTDTAPAKGTESETHGQSHPPESPANRDAGASKPTFVCPMHPDVV